MNIIVLDDDRATNFLNQRLIKGAFVGADVQVFTSASELISFLKETENNKFKLLLDVNMPEMNGFQFLDACKKENLSDRIEVAVMLSTENPEHVKKQMEERAVEKFIQKPLTIENLKLIFND